MIPGVFIQTPGTVGQAACPLKLLPLKWDRLPACQQSTARGNTRNMAILEIIDAKSPESIVKSVRILDVINGTLGAETDVKITNGRITSLDKTPAGRSTLEIPGEGLILMPGLIDCHAHILSPFLTSQKNNVLAPWVFRQIGRNLATNLASGVIAVRDMLSPIKVMNGFRSLIAKGKVHGPDIAASGAIISCKGGYPEFITPMHPPISTLIGTPKYEFSNPEAARKAVRVLHKSGANHIKVGYSSRTRDNLVPDSMPVVSFEVLDAVCKEAHSLGLIVSVHHNYSDDIPRILRADVDTLEHQICDGIISDECVELIIKKGVKIVPTLTVSHDMSYFDKKTDFFKTQASRELFEPQAHKLLAFITSTWLDENEKSYHDVFGYWRANKTSYSNNFESAKKLYKAGVPMLAGTDFGAVVTFSGELSEEVHRLTLIGMSNIEAIRSATIEAAKLLGMSGDIGTIEPGKKASFMLIGGNPLEDITALTRVKKVAKDGRWYNRGGDTASPFWNSGYTLQ